MSIQKMLTMSFFSGVGATIYALYHVVVVLYGLTIQPGLLEMSVGLLLNVSILAIAGVLASFPLSFLPIQKVNENWVGFVNGYVFAFVVSGFFDSNFLIVSAILASVFVFGLVLYTIYRPLEQKFMMGSVLLITFGSVGGLTAYVPHQPRYGTAPNNAPNVLLITVEGLRFDHLASNGHPFVNTDGFDQLIQDGISLENAYVQGTASFDLYEQLILGKDPWESSSLKGNVGDHFRGFGYRTAAFVGSGYLKDRYKKGFDVYDDDFSWIQGVKDSFAGKLLNRVLALEPDNRLGEHSVDNLVGWLLEDSKRPFFALLQFHDADWPFTPPSPWSEDYFSANPREVKENSLDEISLTAQQRKELDGITDLNYVKAQYAGGVAYVAKQVETLLQHLEENDLRRNTCIVLIGSHGMAFGEQGKWFSAEASSDSAMFHVPVIFSFPGILPVGTRVDGLIEAGDIIPTILEVLPQDSFGRPGMVNVLYGSSGRSYARGQVVLSSPRPILFFDNKSSWLSEQDELKSETSISDPEQQRAWMQFIK
jgi:hypothetical protein